MTQAASRPLSETVRELLAQMKAHEASGGPPARLLETWKRGLRVHSQRQEIAEELTIIIIRLVDSGLETSALMWAELLAAIVGSMVAVERTLEARGAKEAAAAVRKHGSAAEGHLRSSMQSPSGGVRLRGSAPKAPSPRKK